MIEIVFGFIGFTAGFVMFLHRQKLAIKQDNPKTFDSSKEFQSAPEKEEIEHIDIFKDETVKHGFKSKSLESEDLDPSKYGEIENLDLSKNEAIKHSATDQNKAIEKGGDANLLASLTVSVVIPARNEEKNIAGILSDLKNQTMQVHEIICVDDASNDRTAVIAESFGVRVISVCNKPMDWTGKSFACQTGADYATGDILLFLDADVRLSPEAIEKLCVSYQYNPAVLSVQPFHMVEKLYEQLSFLFNAALIAANGSGCIFPVRPIGLFGPVIWIPREAYLRISGHYCARSSIVDDLALGEALSDKGIPTRLYWGDRDFRFRMYRNGWKDMYHGWCKNFATGASKTSTLLFAMLFLWFYSMTGVAILLLQSILLMDLTRLALCSAFYIAWVLELSMVARRIGSFKTGLLFFYPFHLIAFGGIFMVSIFKKRFHRKVVWKDRNLDADE